MAQRQLDTQRPAPTGSSSITVARRPEMPARRDLEAMNPRRRPTQARRGRVGALRSRAASSRSALIVIGAGNGSAGHPPGRDEGTIEADRSASDRVAGGHRGDGRPRDREELTDRDRKHDVVSG